MTEPTSPQALTAALAEFAVRQVVLVALDFDGVLAPIQIDPATSRPLPEAATAMRRLAGASGVQLAVVSGRPAADLGTLATPPPGTWLVGSHGAETAGIDDDGALHHIPADLRPEQAALLAQVTDALEQIAADYPPAWVEHKPVSAVLHTRELAGRDPAAAEQALAAAAAGPGQSPGTHPQSGHQVLEIPVLAATKGEALTRLRDRLGADYGRSPSDIAVLYAGDDVTDETALATLDPGDVGIKVGTAPTVATVRVADPAAMARALHQLADLRQGPG